jgi:nitroreductase
MYGHPEFDLFEAIYTTRAMRRLKPDPVPREIIMRIIEAATMAPSNSNRQPWMFMVVTAPNNSAHGALHRAQPTAV